MKYETQKGYFRSHIQARKIVLLLHDEGDHTDKQQNGGLGKACPLYQGLQLPSWPRPERHRRVSVQEAAGGAQLCHAAGTQVQGRVRQLQGTYAELRGRVLELLS